MFGLFDFVVIFAYLALVVLIGYVESKKQTEEGFLIANRNLGMWSGIATINATKTGGLLLSYTALVYLYGVSAFWAFIGVGLGYLLFIPFAKRLREHSSGRFYTLADYFKKRYGGFAAKMASVINIIMMVGFFVGSLVASAKVIDRFVGVDYVVATIVTSAVVLIYLLLAGFKAVVKTDVLQYAVIVFVLLYLALYLFGGATISPDEFALLQAGPATIIGLLLIGFLLPFASPDLWQRVYALKDERVMSKSILYSVIIYVGVGAVLTLIALSIKSVLPELDPDIAIVDGFAQLLPAGLTGLAVIVFFGAFMSSMDTYAFTASSSFIQDFFSRDLKKALIVSRIRLFMAMMVIVSTGIALFLRSVIDAAFLFVAFASVLSIPVIATWVRPKIKKKTVEVALVVGLVILSIFIVKDVLGAGLDPTLILKGIVGALLGLVIGALYAKMLVVVSRRKQI